MSPSTTHPSSPATFVLLHGAWHGAWCWRRVSDQLRERGHRVYLPTLTGLGERSHLLSANITLNTHADDLINTLLWEDLSDVILVGHSFGGIAVSAAADIVPERIRSLIYLDSLLIQNGESPFSVVPAEVAAARRKLAQESPDGLTIPVPPPEAFGVSDPADAQWLRDKCTPHPVSTYESSLSLRHPLGNGLPVTYIAVQPEYGPLQSVREWVKQQSDWEYISIDAGHDAMVTSPDTVTALLLDIAARAPTASQ